MPKTRRMIMAETVESMDWIRHYIPPGCFAPVELLAVGEYKSARDTLT